MATEVGQATIKLTFDTKSLSASQKEVESQASKSGSSWGSAWTVAAGNLIAAGAQKIVSGVVQLGKKVVEVGSAFESQMSKVKAISSATGDEFTALNDKAKEMGASTIFTATEVGQGFEYMAMAGWETDDILNGISGVLNLAAASGEDLATTSDIVTDALTALGYSASDAAHFADVMAAASTSANTDVGMMGESFKYVASSAGALGYSIEDVSLGLGVMANTGIKASSAGEQLRTIFTRLATNTNGAQTAIQELGVEFFNSDGSARDFSNVLNDLRKATAGMTQEEKVNFANKVAGMRAQEGLLAMLNASEDEYYKVADAIVNADGRAQEMADTMNDNLEGALTLLGSQWEATLNSLYEHDLSGFFKNLAGTFSQLGTVIVQAAPAVVDGVKGLIEAAATMLPEFLTEIAPVLLNGVIDIILSLAEHLDEIMVGLQDFIFTVVETIIPRLPELLLGLVNGIIDALKALSSPERMKQMMDIMLELLLVIVDVIPDIIVALLDALPQILDNIITFLTSPETLKALFQAAFTLFQKLIEAVPEIGGKLIATVGEWFGKVWEHIKEIFGGVGEWFGNLVGEAWAWVQEKLAGVGEFFSGIWTGITEIFAGVGEWFGGVVQGAWDGIQNILAGVGNFFAGIWEGIKKVFSVVVDFFKGIWNGVLNAFETVGNAIKDAFQGVWNFIKNIFETIGNIVKAPINGIISGINGVLSKINSIKIPDWVPIIGGAHTNFGMIPYLANGGFATGMTPAIIGEAGDEVVLPLERNVESWAGPLAQILENELSGGGDGDDEDMTPLVVNLNLDGTQIEQVFLQDVRRAI